MAALAGAVRRVEGEDPRLELRDRGAAVEAGEALAEGEAVGDPLGQLPRPLRPLDPADVLGRLPLLGLAGAALREHVDLDDASREGGRRLDRLREPAAQVALHHQAVDDDRDVVVVLLVELDLLVQPAQLVVHPDPAVALEAELLEELLELALAAPDDRRHHHEARALLQGHDAIGDLLDRLPLDRLAALGAVRIPDPRPEQAQVVVDLGDRARPSTAGSARWSSGRSRSPARARRSSRRRASPSGRGTGAHRPRATRRSGAAPRRRSCRRQGSTYRTRRGR